jgi:hypothetical protein
MLLDLTLFFLSLAVESFGSAGGDFDFSTIEISSCFKKLKDLKAQQVWD